MESSGRTVTEYDVVSFASLTGDWHPQHADAAWAAESPFGRRIAHGMLVISYALGLLPIDPRVVMALRSIDGAALKRPVGLGDTIRVQARVAELRPLGDEAGLVTLGVRIRNQDDELVARMEITVLWRREPEHSSRRPPPDPPATRASPGTSSPRSRTGGCSPDARRQATADHRGPHPEEHRLRGRPRGTARRRRGGPDGVRPLPADDRASSGAPSRDPRRDRARRQLRRRPHGSRGRDRSPLGPARWRPARDCLRPRGCDRRPLPRDAARERRPGVPDERLLLRLWLATSRP